MGVNVRCQRWRVRTLTLVVRARIAPSVVGNRTVMDCTKWGCEWQ